MILGTSQARGQSGETLIEILISVAIMGLVMVGLLSGLTTATIAGDTHRRLTDVEVVAREYGEAVIARAATPRSTKITQEAAAGSDVVQVSSISGFLKAMSVSVDGEVRIIKDPPAGNALKFTQKLDAGHPIGSAVTAYESCPGPSSFEVSGFTSLAAGIEDPRVTLVEYLAQPAGPSAAPLVVGSWDGTGTPPTACSDYWFTSGMPCSKYEDTVASPRPHYPVCDPPLLRISISVASTESPGSARGAKTSTQVLFNRGNP